ncbi:MAG TPA: peptidylprolyl isomerase [Polyangiaceae bacterium]|nr:peptidylprolyl isomerase [Polyangiaceae bacterium]
MLWVSQILIRHGQSSLEHPCFSLADWHSVPALPVRSRGEALALTRDLAQQLERSPERFAELARLHSEDICTRDAGGSFGGVTASQFQPFPEVLDALAATPAGTVSRVVETRYGFHIFQRRPPPPEQVVSGARIVIAHDDAGFIKLVARGVVPARSRLQALALANEIHARAATGRERFSDLVERHSEHRDALRGGDLGAWSTREPSDWPREVELLAQLRVGEVAPPIDSPLGYEILQRTEARPRQTYAVEEIRLAFSPDLPAERPGSEASVLAVARSMAQEARRSPDAFARFQREHCCVGKLQWDEGRGSAALERALAALAPGEVGAEPVRAENGYVVVQRVAATAAARATSFELPAPTSPNIALQIMRHDAEFARAQLEPVMAEALSALPLQGEEASRLARLHDGGDLFAEQTRPSERAAAFEAQQRRVAELLGTERYARYRALLDARFERLLLARR